MTTKKINMYMVMRSITNLLRGHNPYGIFDLEYFTKCCYAT